MENICYWKKEIEETCNPVIAKLYQQVSQSGGNEVSIGMSCATQSRAGFGKTVGPTVEEVD